MVLFQELREGSGEDEGHHGQGNVPAWGMVTLALHVPSIQELSLCYSELQQQYQQIGLDDCLFEWFGEKRRNDTDAAVDEGSIPACRTMARCGVPSGSRPALWATALCISTPSAQDKQEFESLCCEVESRQLLTDLLVSADVENHVATSPDYFLFQEELRAVLLAFTRDPTVSGSCRAEPQPQLVGMGKGGRRHGTYPPSGVLPFAGLSLLCAPLCYLYSDPSDVFHTFRAMYCRHWSCLQSLSPDGMPSPSLPALCRSFEALLQEIEPEVCWHLYQIRCPPLKIAFPWLARAFVGYLQLDQVLLLWDRIIGFDSLMPLAMLGAAIMAFRCLNRFASITSLSIHLCPFCLCLCW
mmetsp:Transcript_34788/g.82505  ORF Transcript_34788/g.82505 Transcript_34788/m.82505 type:complete len:354 (+) Transcript_34788:278-1339(+)